MERQQTIERSLLDSTWRSPSKTLTPSEHLAYLASQGRFAQVLRSPRCQELRLFSYDDGQLGVRPAEDEIAMLAIAVSLLHGFAQANWTGPELEFEARELLDGAAADGLDSAAIRLLGFGGEPAYHLAKQAPLLVWSLQLLEALSAERPSRTWQLESVRAWRLRAGLIRLHILEEPVTLPDWLIDDAKQFSSSAVLDEADLRAAHTLTLGHYYAHVSNAQSSAYKLASETFYRATAEAELAYELTGRLGKRTKFQTFETSQLVVLAQGRDRKSWKPRKVAAKGEKDESTAPSSILLNDDTLLERTAYSVSPAAEPRDGPSALASLDPANQPVLHPLDECILLGLSLNVQNTSPDHGLTTLQITAFVQRVIDDGSQNWSVYTMALLLRSRLEATRSRTVERGLLQIQSLVDQFKLQAEAKETLAETGADARERLEYLHVLALPTRWELERELARRYLGLGVVRSALEIYERLEMWDEAARCWAQSGRRDKAITLVRDLLEGKKTESDALMAVNGRPGAVEDPQRLAKLWCLLGELENEPEHYRKAWQVSGERSSKAMRSLGGHLFTKGDFAQARDCFKISVKISPLDVRTWFLMGCAALHEEDWPLAEEAFGRVVALDDEDAESWSNLASVHLRRIDEATGATTDDRPSQVAFDRKRAAYSCLKQAVRRSYDNWRIWQNYMVVAVDVGELDEACRALGRVVEIRAEKEGEKAVDLDVLERLVTAATRAEPNVSAADAAQDAVQSATHGLAKRVRILIEDIILPRLSLVPRVHLANARLQLWAGDATGALDSHLKAYRCGPGSSSDSACETDRVKFNEAAQAVRDAVDALRSLGPRANKSDWAYQARSILRSFLGRTKGSFEDEAEWTALQEELEEFKAGR